MAEVEEDQVRNLTNIQTDEVSSGDMTGLISLAEDKVEEDIEGASPDPGKIERLELLYASHLVKLKMRGAEAITSDGQTELEDIDPEVGTIYSVMYEDEKSNVGSPQFGHAG
jgi:hypothetical protein